MADTIFTDWLSALKNLQSSVSKDLSEIRKQKAEIQQLKADILNQVACGKFIRDNERIVLSAPEIVIGNVDASGMLYGDNGSIVIRGQNVGIEGAGEQGTVQTRAAVIAQTAVDPGPRRNWISWSVNTPTSARPTVTTRRRKSKRVTRSGLPIRPMYA